MASPSVFRAMTEKFLSDVSVGKSGIFERSRVEGEQEQWTINNEQYANVPMCQCVNRKTNLQKEDN